MRKILILVGALILLAMLPAARRHLTVSRPHSDLIDKRIFAYRDWQSTGVRVNLGDRVEIDARGEWLYTPDEYHGPEGHAVFPAPIFYPIPNAAGGVLIGRIGESGQRMVIGVGNVFQASEHGVIFLRINDDVLTDNDGWVAVQIDVTKTEESLP